MKKHELDQAVKLYILSTIEEDGEGKSLTTFKEKCEYLKERFNAEYKWRVEQVGQQRACTDWLQGVALNIEFMNYKILELAVKWGSIPENATEKQEEKILNNYWQFMAAKVCQLMNGYRVPKQ